MVRIAPTSAEIGRLGHRIRNNGLDSAAAFRNVQIILRIASGVVAWHVHILSPDTFLAICDGYPALVMG
jgi:hypothetical protein